MGQPATQRYSPVLSEICQMLCRKVVREGCGQSHGQGCLGARARPRLGKSIKGEEEPLQRRIFRGAGDHRRSLPGSRLNSASEQYQCSMDLSSDHLQVDCDFRNHERRKKASQSWPVSVSEAPVREDDSGISITQNIDFHGHQSKELTSNSLNPGVKSSNMLRLSNEDSREESDLIPQSVYLEEDFMDEEERDYTYLLDILFVSGIHSSKQDNLFNACHLPEYPVNPTLFENLEKKFGKLVAWSKSERKLMFDMTNSILAEILAPCMDPLPWVNSIRTIGPMWSSEGLVEKSWKILVKKRAELSFGNAEDKALDFKWLDFGDHINDIGCEIERLLKEELLEELVEFIQE